MLKVQSTDIHFIAWDKIKGDLKTRIHLHSAYVIYLQKPERIITKSIIKSTAKNADSAMRLVANTSLQIQSIIESQFFSLRTSS